MNDPPIIWEQLLAVMGEVQAIGKNERNQQQNFNFRGIDAVVNAVGPAFRKHGVICTPHLLKSARRQYETGRGTIMMESMVEVEYRFVAQDGSSTSCVVPGESSDAGDKGLSKAMSVAYRTALLQVLCIPTDDQDPDAVSTSRKATKATSAARKAERQSPGRPAGQEGTPTSSSAPAAAGGPECSACGKPIGTAAFKKHEGKYVHLECPT